MISFPRILVLCSVAFVAVETKAQNAQLAEDLHRCSAIADDVGRLACYDKLAASLAIAGSGHSEPVPTPPSRDDLDPEDLFGLDDSHVREALELKEVQEIVQVIERIRKTSLGQWVIVLNNGQIWVQKDSTVLNLSEGDRVRITAGIFGSFYLAPVDGGRRLKVKRAN